MADYIRATWLTAAEEAKIGVAQVRVHALKQARLPIPPRPLIDCSRSNWLEHLPQASACACVADERSTARWVLEPRPFNMFKIVLCSRNVDTVHVVNDSSIAQGANSRQKQR